MPPQATHSGGYYVFAMSRCPDACPIVSYMLQWRHHMTTCVLKLSGYNLFL